MDISLLQCWIEISKLRNATGEQMFKELSNFALRVLTLGTSIKCSCREGI